MKLRDFEQHLVRHGCYVRREGGEHTIYKNAANSHSAAVPRHGEVKTTTLRRICKTLEIPIPLTR
jgi:predicted RNA binding protein YcfA (HicA-like mRNA interferase family)